MSAGCSDADIAVPGGVIFTRVWNPARSRLAPIILLHDSLGSVDLWREFPAALAQATARPVAAYDRLGFGRSTPRHELPDTDFIREEAEVLFPPLLEGLGISDFLLFGHSVGGPMAITIAAGHPDRCRLVITESAQAFVEERTLAGIQAAKEAFARPKQFARLVKWHGDKAQWVLDAWTRTWLSPARRSWSLDAALARVRCPVLAIHGDGDEYGSEAFPRRITKKVQGPARMELLSACGHVPHRERREEVLRLAAGFIHRHCG